MNAYSRPFSLLILKKCMLYIAFDCNPHMKIDDQLDNFCL